MDGVDFHIRCHLCLLFGALSPLGHGGGRTYGHFVTCFTMVSAGLPCSFSSRSLLATLNDLRGTLSLYFGISVL